MRVHLPSDTPRNIEPGFLDSAILGTFVYSQSVNQQHLEQYMEEFETPKSTPDADRATVSFCGIEAGEVEVPCVGLPVLFVGDGQISFDAILDHAASLRRL